MNEMVQTNKMLSRKEGRVGYVIFNNPERRNAVSLEMWETTARILDDFGKDGDIRVVVLTGAGAGFCAKSDSRFRFSRAAPVPAAARIRFRSGSDRLSAHSDSFPCANGRILAAVAAAPVSLGHSVSSPVAVARCHRSHLALPNGPPGPGVFPRATRRNSR